MNFLFGHAKRGSAKNQRMHSGKTNGWTPKMMEIPKESPFPGVRKNIRCQKCGFFGIGVFFFFDPSSNLRTPPQMPQEDLGMVEKQSGSKGRKLLEKAGIRGEVAGGIFRRPNKKRPNLLHSQKRPKYPS